MKAPFTRKTAALALLVLTAGCAARPIGKPVVWPAPPDTPRIRFVTAFRSGADLDLSAGAEFMRALVAGNRDVSIVRPQGIALSPDGGKLYIADYPGGRVLVADFKAKTLQELANSDVIGWPFGIAVDAKGRIYVADQPGKRVVVISPAGERLLSFGREEELVRPCGVAVDSRNGLVYVADPATIDTPDHRVLVYDFEGKLVRTMGEGRGSENGQFNVPLWVAVDSAGRLYVVDALNFRVQVFESDGAFVAAFGKNGDSPGDFSRPKGIAVDKFGVIYVAEGEVNVVQLFNQNYEPLMYFGGPTDKLEYPDMPAGIAVDPATNRIYLANEGHPRINVYELINTTSNDPGFAGQKRRK
ncbi:MAG: SMP-30/gluconolactonase/LRE family protein [Deltaproteobacteria bacterium]|nr:SMP-30/gluconolactonase/LRE family protein [Deltaproteobacteria bacterium]